MLIMGGMEATELFELEKKKLVLLDSYGCPNGTCQ